MNCCSLKGRIEKKRFVSGSIQKTHTINATLSKPEIVILYEIPSNYGLITWNGSYLTVS